VKAAVYRRYGPPEVVAIEELLDPVPKDDEVLIGVRATTVTSADHRARSLDMPRGFGALSRLVFGLSGPRQRILGTEAAGVIEAVGRAVTNWKPGDEVLAFTGIGMGCHAELKCVKASAALARKPASLSFEEAASLPFGGTTALEFLRRGKVKAGERVLVNGASGCVGTAAVQLAKHFGAHVTGVCSSANLELVRSLGADEVIDYTKQDFSALGQRYDAIVDTVGTAPLSRSARALEQDGRLLLVLGDLPAMLGGAWASLTTDKKVISGPAAERAEDLRVLIELAERGVLKPVIDGCYPLARIAEAHARVDSGRKRGSVVITL
jgi:NADPH:quinone reductase-like Zn-dependent oxidoreductase